MQGFRCAAGLVRQEEDSDSASKNRDSMESGLKTVGEAIVLRNNNGQGSAPCEI